MGQNSFRDIVDIRGFFKFDRFLVLSDSNQILMCFSMLDCFHIIHKNLFQNASSVAQSFAFYVLHTSIKISFKMFQLTDCNYSTYPEVLLTTLRIRTLDFLQ